MAATHGKITERKCLCMLHETINGLMCVIWLLRMIKLLKENACVCYMKPLMV